MTILTQMCFSWDNETFLASQKEQDEFQDSLHPTARQKPTQERESLSQQAKEMIRESRLSRENTFLSADNLEEIEVEADVNVKTDADRK